MWHRIAAVLALLTLTSQVAAEENLPLPLKALQAQGVEIIEEFAAPSGLSAYAARMRGQSFAVYITDDGEHALVGTLLDSSGNDLTSGPLQALVEGPVYQEGWPRLEQAEWVADGPDDAEHIVYAFTDPNCPFCHKFWEASRPWIESGQAQVRHLMVGILRPSSLGKAAAILSANDPSAALARHETSWDEGGIEELEDIPRPAQATLQKNYQLMQHFGAQATPTIIYKSSEGQVQLVRGLPPRPRLTEMFGPLED